MSLAMAASLFDVPVPWPGLPDFAAYDIETHNETRAAAAKQPGEAPCALMRSQNDKRHSAKG